MDNTDNTVVFGVWEMKKWTREWKRLALQFRVRVCGG